MTKPPVSAEVLETALRSAGADLMRYFGTRLQVQEKQKLEPVTQADLASEKILVEHLLKILPGAAIISEETASKKGNEYCWIIDPLDGTNNFVHGIGYFCISIALAYNGTVVQGAIYQPVFNEFFYAERDAGAFLNGTRITVTPWSRSPMLSFAYVEASDYHKLVDAIPFNYTFRHLGAAALDLAYVACGRLDGVISQKLKWWDIAAGVLLVQEAGGMATDFAGCELKEHSASCIAGNPRMYQQLIRVLDHHI